MPVLDEHLVVDCIYHFDFCFAVVFDSAFALISGYHLGRICTHHYLYKGCLSPFLLCYRNSVWHFSLLDTVFFIFFHTHLGTVHAHQNFYL